MMAKKNFLSNNVSSFGIDISDSSIKFVELIKSKTGIDLVNFKEIEIMPNTIKFGDVKKHEVLGEILKIIKKDIFSKNVYVSLSKEHSYVFSIKVDNDEKGNIKEIIQLSMESRIPVIAQDVVFDYFVFDERKEHSNVQVVASSKIILDGYMYAFENAKMGVLSYEMSSQAIARSVIKKGDKETYMIIDFGKNNATLSIVSKEIILFSTTINFGSENITNAISNALHISYEEAEIIKIKNGLYLKDDYKEAFPFVVDEISFLIQKILEIQIYWDLKKDKNFYEYPNIRKIIICGGGANLKGFAEYLSVNLKTEVVLANVWSNIYDLHKNIPKMTKDQSLSFACAIGLALGGV